MTEWHVTPDYIVNNWTDELFDLMVEKLIARHERESRALGRPGPTKVSDKELFSRASNLIKEVKSGD